MFRSMIKTMILLMALAVVSSGCTWIKLTPEAGEVQIGAANAVANCKRVGTTKARTKTKVGFIARSQEKVAKELATLARNDATELGGNTVVADGPISADGVQRFVIYDCPVDVGDMP